MVSTKPGAVQDFITKALVSVVRGIEGAQEQLKDSAATLNPLGYLTQIALEQGKETPPLEKVEFEVAVTVQSTGKKGAKLGARIAVVEFGVGGDQTDSRADASRLKFAVPIHLPPGDVLKLKQKGAKA